MPVEAFIFFERSTAAMPDVRGESTDPPFREFFKIDDFAFSVENTTAIGSATTGAAAGKAQFNEFTIKKRTDAASPFFFRNCAAGAHYKLVTLAIRKGVDLTKVPKPYVVFNFGVVFCKKIDWAAGDEGPEESITFVYGALDVAAATPRADGSMVTEPLKNMSWNQMSNKAEFATGVVPRVWP